MLEFQVRGPTFGGNRVYTDRNLTCGDCGATFVFTTGEQEFYATKGFSSDPRRCPDCRRARKNDRDGGGYGRGGGGGAREMHEVVCDGCGQTTQVPFRPRGDRPVYCSDCFRSHQTTQVPFRPRGDRPVYCSDCFRSQSPGRR